MLAAQRSAEPSDPAAHWHSGEVRVGQEWLPYEKVADHGDRWKEMYDYRNERSKKQYTVDDQLFLADGSRQHKLFDEERAHLQQVVAIDPQHAEAHSRLGDVQYEGHWVSRESAEKSVRMAQRWQGSYVRYGDKAARIVQRLRKSSGSSPEKVTSQLNTLLDPESIPAIEAAIGDPGDWLQSGYIRWLSEFPCYEATQGLARQAIFSEHPEVRVMATEALKSRPFGDYMREMVCSLAVLRPVEKPRTFPGQAAHLVSFSVDSLDGRIDAQFLLRNPVERLTVLETSATVGFVDLHLDVGSAATQLWQSSLTAAVLKDQTRAGRALRVISQVGEVSLKNTEEAWDWWRAQEDGDSGKELVSLNYERAWYVDRRTRRIERAPRQIVRQKTCPPGSCLAAGTLLVTETGSRPIEEVEIGDRVLTQDIETGELTFKPVLARTMREGAGLTRLKAGDNEIVCSNGHPFWVNAVGWVQARYLKEGMPLHSVRGSIDVVSSEPAGQGNVYNLIVADTHSYFLGKTNAILSHDITPRDPTNALVPGLQPVWMTPGQSAEDRPVTAR